jgi:hypothetical protein
MTDMSYGTETSARSCKTPIVTTSLGSFSKKTGSSSGLDGGCGMETDSNTYYNYSQLCFDGKRFLIKFLGLSSVLIRDSADDSSSASLPAPEIRHGGLEKVLAANDARLDIMASRRRLTLHEWKV